MNFYHVTKISTNFGTYTARSLTIRTRVKNKKTPLTIRLE